MRSNLAKVLHRLDGRPSQSRLPGGGNARPAQSLCRSRSSGRDVNKAVLEELDEEHAEFVGRRSSSAGDAVNAARSFWRAMIRRLIVLIGYVPMIRKETLIGLIQQHKNHRGKGAACTF